MNALHFARHAIHVKSRLARSQYITYSNQTARQIANLLRLPFYTHIKARLWPSIKEITLRGGTAPINMALLRTTRLVQVLTCIEPRASKEATTHKLRRVQMAILLLLVDTKPQVLQVCRMLSSIWAPRLLHFLPAQLPMGLVGNLDIKLNLNTKITKQKDPRTIRNNTALLRHSTNRNLSVPRSIASQVRISHTFLLLTSSPVIITSGYLSCQVNSTRHNPLLHLHGLLRSTAKHVYRNQQLMI